MGFRLNRFLYALCWTGTDRPSTLFDRAVAWLVAAKVLLPGLSVLERAVARVRSRATGHLFRRLTSRLTTEQRARLDALVVVPDGARQSPLDRLREGPFIRSGPEIGRAVARSEEIRAIGAGLPEAERLPPGKVTALARFASTARAQAVARLPDDRRAATLLAFVRTLEASATDDVIDLFDAVSTAMFAQADAASREARLRSLRDLDAAALKLRDAGAVILDAATPDTDVRAAVLALVSRDALAAAVERVGRLAEPPDDTFFAELRKRSRTFRYVPALLRGLELEAAPAGKALLDAVAHLRVVRRTAASGPARRQSPSRRRGGGSAQDRRRAPRPGRLPAGRARRPAPRDPPARRVPGALALAPTRARTCSPARPGRLRDRRSAGRSAISPSAARGAGPAGGAARPRLSRDCRTGAGNPAVAIVEHARRAGPLGRAAGEDRGAAEPGRAARRRRRAAAAARPARAHPGGACAHGLRRPLHPRERGSRQDRGRRHQPLRRARRRGRQHRLRAARPPRHAGAQALAAGLGEAELRPRRDADGGQRGAGGGAERDRAGAGLGRRRGGLGRRPALRRAGAHRSTPGRTRATSAASAGSPGTTSPPTSTRA